MNIIVIEPHKTIRQACVLALERRGHQVAATESAQSAITSIDSNLPDCIVLELLLPTHNGIEFLYELRSYVDWQSVPVVIYSLVPENIMHNRVIASFMGEVFYLYKPKTSLAQLVQTVEDTAQKTSSKSSSGQ